MVRLWLGEVRLEEIQVSGGTACGLAFDDGCGGCRGVCDGGLRGVVRSELRGKVSRERRGLWGNWCRERLDESDVGVFSLQRQMSGKLCIDSLGDAPSAWA